MSGWGSAVCSSAIWGQPACSRRQDAKLRKMTRRSGVVCRGGGATQKVRCSALQRIGLELGAQSGVSTNRLLVDDGVGGDGGHGGLLLGDLGSRHFAGSCLVVLLVLYLLVSGAENLGKPRSQDEEPRGQERPRGPGKLDCSLNRTGNG
jgi:hypothetical protein